MTSFNKYFAKRKQVNEWLTQEVVAEGPGYFILDYKGPHSYSADGGGTLWNTYEFISWIFGEQTVEYDVSSYLVEQCGINIPLDQDILKNGFNRTSQLIFTLHDIRDVLDSLDLSKRVSISLKHADFEKIVELADSLKNVITAFKLNYNERH